MIKSFSHGARRRLQDAAPFAAALALAACATPGNQVGSAASTTSGVSAGALAALHREDVAWLQRVSFGLDSRTVAEYRRLGRERYLEAQLHPRGDALPGPVAVQIRALEVSQTDPAGSLAKLHERRRTVNAMVQGTDQEQARKELNEEGNHLEYQAVRLQLLRAIYSPAQLREQMVWFWLNHFSVHQYKADERWLVADYEEHAIRPHALGHFRDLVLATLEHPAMLQYLDNNQNAVGHVNENYARELMELHTLGVDGGYSQKDVQELARVLTGLGINATAKTPPVKPALQAQYVRDGLFEFNPNRHDYGDKQLLGRNVRGRGLAEVDEVAELLAKHPATAHFISHKLAVYFVADEPPATLVERMANTFRQSDGDVAATLATMFHSPEFTASLGHKFKDPIHYSVSAVRLAYGDKPILNTNPMLGWLNRMGEPLYGRLTPDGYALTQAAWSSPGQMVARFEVARTIGSNSAGLFKPDAPDAVELPAFPQLANALYYTTTTNRLDTATHEALDQAKSPQEWNMFLLASPEFMHR